jgi:pimeloyl-ACP methyl ester carboxylesterase
MPSLRLAPDFTLHYEVDDYTDPWAKPEAVLLMHGNCESGLAWFGWVPQLARRYRVVRPDMRGFGRSSPVERDFRLDANAIIGDYLRLMDALGIARFHVIAAKIGGVVARAMAARHPERVITLTVVGTPPPYRADAVERIPAWVRDFDEHGVEPWARRTMRARLGVSMPEEAVEWWIRYMGRTSRESQIAYTRNLACEDIRGDIARIRCPTLVVTTEESGLASVGENRRWQREIRDSELLVLPGNSYHAAVTHAEECARAALEFIDRH